MVFPSFDGVTDLLTFYFFTLLELLVLPALLTGMMPAYSFAGIEYSINVFCLYDSRRCALFTCDSAAAAILFWLS